MKKNSNPTQSTLSTPSSLIKRHCSYYKDGTCLPYNEQCYMFRKWNILNLNSTKPEIPKGTKICRHFKYSVLPLNPQLHSHICSLVLERDKKYTTNQLLNQESVFLTSDNIRPEYLDPVKAMKENRKFIPPPNPKKP